MADKWIGPAVQRMKEKGTIGSFSRAARKAGKSTGSFARSVMANPKASSAMRKKANFAINVAKSRG
jgi:hypothetical protein